MKAKVDPDALFEAEGSAPFQKLQETLQAADGSEDPRTLAAADGLRGLVWIKALKRMYCLVHRSAPCCLPLCSGFLCVVVCGLNRGQEHHFTFQLTTV
jgi:hypothetical protein